MSTTQMRLRLFALEISRKNSPAWFLSLRKLNWSKKIIIHVKNSIFKNQCMQKWQAFNNTYRVIVGGQGCSLLNLKSFVKDLLGEYLILYHIDSLWQALVLLTFFCHCHLHLPHCIISFVNLCLAQLYVPLQWLYCHFEILDDLAKLNLLSFLLCCFLDLLLLLLAQLLLLRVKFANPDL